MLALWFSELPSTDWAVGGRSGWAQPRKVKRMGPKVNDYT